MIDLYRNIKDFRISLGLTQADLAKRTGYADKSMIAKIERGIIDLPQSKIELFANALNTTPRVLMGWENEKSPYIQELISIASKCDPEDIQIATEMLKRVAELKGR